MRYPIFALRISDDAKEFFNNVKNQYGADDGVNRMIEAISKFCTTGNPDVDGINIKQFFEDALAGRLLMSNALQDKLRAQDENIYARFTAFLNGEFGSNNILPLICEGNTAGEFFSKFPKHIKMIQQEFLISKDGCPVRMSDVKRYVSRWYQEKLDDGSADACLKQNILRSMED